MSDWWVQEPGQRPSGPVATAVVVRALAEGRMRPGTLVCGVAPGSQWAPVESVRALVAGGGPRPPNLPAPEDDEGGYRGGYVRVARRDEAPAKQEEWRRPAQRPSRATLALVLATLLCLSELALFGVGFVFLSRFDQLSSFGQIGLLVILFVLPFVATCFYGWVTWGLAQYRAPVYRRAQRGHIVFAVLVAIGGVIAILATDVVVGILVLSPLILYALAYWSMRRAEGEWREDLA